MNKLLPIILASLSMAIPALAGRIITYTASSSLSQEDANNAAMAGVAKQIVSTVNASQTVSKTETTRDGKSVLGENFFSNNNVTSDIQLKGVSVVPVKTDGKMFKATATLDLDEFTSDLQFRIKTIKMSVARLETEARDAVKNRKYGKAANALKDAKAQIPEYEGLIEKLGKVYPLNDSHRLVHHLPEIENQLVAELSAVKMEGPAGSLELTTAEMPEWKLLVKDTQGPLSDFPVLVRQGSKTLAEKRTDENGYATFRLKNASFAAGPYVIEVQPNLPRDLMRAAGLDQVVSISYKVKQKRCEIRLSCNENDNVCSAVEDALEKKSIFPVMGNNASAGRNTMTGDNAPPDFNAPEVNFSISATERGSLSTGNGSLKSFDVSISMTGEKLNFQTHVKGVGKTPTDAAIKAIQKADFGKLQSQLEPYCR